MTQTEREVVKDMERRQEERARGTGGYSEAEHDLRLALGMLQQQEGPAPQAPPARPAPVFF